MLGGSQPPFELRTVIPGTPNTKEFADPAALAAQFDESCQALRDTCAPLTDIDWEVKVATPFGEMSKLQLLGFQNNHNGHHVGQLAQTLKRGQ